MQEPDTARELKPVVMFDDSNQRDPNTKDFRPLAEHIQSVKDRQVMPTRNTEVVSQDDEGDQNPDIAPPEVDAPDGEEAPTSPPDAAPDEGESETPDDDIPSPWDDDTDD